MIAAILGVDAVLIEAGLLTWALIRRPHADEPVFSTSYDADAEARTVVLPPIDVADEPSRIRPYVKYAPPWIETSRDLEPWLRRDLILGHSVLNMLSNNRQWQQLALEGGAA